ncbi:MAG: hypothetical protein NT055_03365, partial [Nitrospirae bacterium]|nr:hypothetical protein [Nitrospirota bacterium]
NYEKKILIIGTPLIGKIADRYIITGKGNLSMASGKSDFPWFALVDENGNVISKRSISESLLFSPSDMVTGKKHCLIVGSEMDMSEDKLKNNMIIFKIGIE